MLAKIGWPQAAIIMTLIACVAATVLAAPALGVADEMVKWVLGAQGIGATLIAWLVKAPGAK